LTHAPTDMGIYGMGPVRIEHVAHTEIP
jgi:hypothetical protein